MIISKLYLASKFSLINRVERVSKYLETNGFEITVRWWEKNFKTALGEMSDEEWYKRLEVQMLRDRNFKGIDDSDALVLIAPYNNTTKFNGANVEVGYAIAKGKPIYSVGRLERSGMYKDIIQTDNVVDLIIKLRDNGVDK